MIQSKLREFIGIFLLKSQNTTTNIILYEASIVVMFCVKSQGFGKILFCEVDFIDKISIMFDDGKCLPQQFMDNSNDSNFIRFTPLAQRLPFKKTKKQYARRHLRCHTRCPQVLDLRKLAFHNRCIATTICLFFCAKSGIFVQKNNNNTRKSETCRQNAAHRRCWRAA